MSNVLPELKKGDRVVRIGKGGDETVLTVRKIGRGTHFDEPVYYLKGKYGVTLRNAYAGEELARMGYTLGQERKAG